jgi:hypothetical protein
VSAWPFDIGLSAMLNAGCFDRGFAGRIYGLPAATLVLLTALACRPLYREAIPAACYYEAVWYRVEIVSLPDIVEARGDPMW